MNGLTARAGMLDPCLRPLDIGRNALKSGRISCFRHIRLFQIVSRATLAGFTLAVLAFSANAVAVTSPIGATPGSFAVSPSGAATYSIPIFVPPGTNGMQPQLSLNYNSQGGNSLLGMGWSIGGLSVIHRCGATITIDGFKGGVNYDANDKFCLDGERLIYIGGTEYRTQHESWQKVSVVGSYFTVTTKDGTVMTYGGTTDSQILPKGNASVVRIWALNRIQNPNGNYLTISYNNQGYTSGEYYPVSIAYTGTGSVAPYNFVYFDYSASVRSDTIQVYEGGSLISTTKLLTGIRSCTNSTCLANNGLVRQYNMDYVNDGAAGRSRLKNIQECGSDGVCLPATALGWNSAAGVGFEAVITTGLSNGTPSNQWLIAADVSGDGRDDIVFYDPAAGQFRVSLASGNQGTFVQTSVNSTFVTAVNGNPSPVNAWFTMAEINGDGLTDAVLYNPTTGTLTAALANSDGSFTLVSPVYSFIVNSSLSPANTWFRMADVDGDGRMDAVLYNPAGTLTVALATGNGAFATPVTTSTDVNFSPACCWFNMTDVNGDGRADAVLYGKRPGVVESPGIIRVALATGNGSFGAIFPTAGPTNWVSTTPDNSWFTMGDVNSDGLADAVLYNPGINTLSVSLATGKNNGGGTGAFAGQSNTTLAAGRTADGLPTSPANSWFMVADVNGDGQADAFLVNYDFTVALATNGGFAASVAVPYGNGVTPSVGWAMSGDTNGDGMHDVILHGSGYVFNVLSNRDYWRDLVTSITDGLSNRTSITYGHLRDTSYYAKDNNAAYPYQDVQEPNYVILGQVSQSNGIGGTNTTNHFYSGLKKHHKANDSLGFRSIKTTDPAGLVTTTTYNQSANTGDYLDGTESTVLSSITQANGVTVKEITRSHLKNGFNVGWVRREAP